MEIEKLWHKGLGTLLFISVGTVVISFFIPVNDYLTDVLFITLFLGYLVGDQLSFHRLENDVKVFYYSATYVILFMLLFRSFNKIAWLNVYFLKPLLALGIGTLVIIQSLIFVLKTPPGWRRVRIYFFVFLSIVLISLRYFAPY